MLTTIRLEVSGGVAHLRLHRPDKMNALNDAMFDELVEATGSLAADRSLRAVVISGEGRGFCAGLDFDQFQAFASDADAGVKPFADPNAADAAPGRRVPGRGQRIVMALKSNPVPVIAAIHGAAIGGGLQLALGADLRFVTPDAKLALRELDFGITPDMCGTQLLPRLVGPDVAMEMILSGRLVSGTEAASIGLATRVCADPVAEALAFAESLTARNPRAVRAVKELVALSAVASLDDGRSAELRVMAANIGTPNQVEATRAYFDKRAPVFVDED